MNLFITNGRVIDPARKVDQRINCLIRNGVVAEWTSARTPPAGATVLDARGAVVTPGWIDIHTHLRDPGEEYKEDVASGAAAAAAGGFTSIVCMANTKPVNDCAAVTRYIRERARNAAVRVYPVGALSRGLEGQALADIGDLKAEGVVAISDDGRNVDNALLMRRALEYTRDFDLPILVHAEESCLCAGGVMHEGEASARLGLRGRPAAAEEVTIRRDAALVRLTGGRVHFQHVSSAEGLAAIAAAKADRLAITAEATPHHLFLTDALLESFDPVFRVNPPLRTPDDRAALRRALRDGLIDCIATDHAPHDITVKGDVPIEDAAPGTVGLETALPVCLRLVEERVVSLARLVELFTTGPARILGLPGGRLQKGDPADITIFDPQRPITIRAADFRSKSRNTVFEGWKGKGKVLYTIVGGNIVYS